MSTLHERVHRIRAKAPLLGMSTAVSIARYEVKQSELPFLNDVPTYFTTGQVARGEHLGFTVTVSLEYDETARLGDDDVTGTFHSTEPGPHCIENKARYYCYSQNGQGEKWYTPANIRVSEADGWKWFHQHDGMSKQVAREYLAEMIRRDMQEDADRNYYVVHVNIAHDGDTLNDQWLAGVDVFDDAAGRAYIIETASNLIDEAFAELRDDTDHQLARAHERIAKLTKLRALLKVGGP
jgi:hypothetical protein